MTSGFPLYPRKVQYYLLDRLVAMVVLGARHTVIIAERRSSRTRVSVREEMLLKLITHYQRLWSDLGTSSFISVIINSGVVAMSIMPYLLYVYTTGS